jgi:prepilin-type N-terminal cleavage/methylation domain-containing protein
LLRVQAGTSLMPGTARTLRGTAGLTLVEVLTAISVIGVLVAIGATSFRAQIPPLRARGAALLIAGDLNQARLSAVKESRRYFFVPGEGTTYQIRFDDGLGDSTLVKQVDIGAEFEGATFGNTGIDDDPYGAEDPAAVPGATMVFHSNGTVQNPASIFVEVALAGDAYAHQAVTVTAAGRIRVWKHAAGDWK